jgi:hypothetical protein
LDISGSQKSTDVVSIGELAYYGYINGAITANRLTVNNIVSSGTHLTVNNIVSSGTIKSLSRPCWSLRYGSGNSAFGAGGVLGWSVLYDTTGGYNTATKLFTIPISGYYMLGVRALIYVATNVARVDIYFRRIRSGVTSSLIKGERLAGTEGGRANNKNITCQLDGTLHLLAGDQLDVYFVQEPNVGTAHVYGSESFPGQFNNWYGYLIEPV